MESKEMKILIAIPSPREFIEVKEALDELKEYDRLWIKNYPEHEAYQIMRNYFLDSDYTHLVIAPDDMPLNRSSFDRLVLDFKEIQFPVLCGYANRDLSNQYKHESTTSINHLPSLEREHREYKFETIKDIERIGLSDNPIIQVKYAGFPCMIISRGVVEWTSFRNDYPLQELGCCIDVVFCYECNHLSIPIFCDTRCRFLHLKESDQMSGKVWHKVREPDTIRRFYIESATETL